MIRRDQLVYPGTLERMQKDALERFPFEACGVIVDGYYVPCENLSKRPHVEAKFGLDYQELYLSRRVQAVFHSHTSLHWNAPSRRDMAFQIATAIPHVIITTDGETCLPAAIWGDQVAPADLYSRPFQHGIADGLACVRDFLRLAGLPYPKPTPRVWPNGFPDGWLSAYSAGQVGLLEIGDVFTGTFAWTEPCAGVYVGDGKVLSHKAGKLPYEPKRLASLNTVDEWLAKGARVYRHDKARSPLRGSG